MEPITQVVETIAHDVEHAASTVVTEVKTVYETVEYEAAKLEGRIKGYLVRFAHGARYDIHAVTHGLIGEFVKLTTEAKTKVVDELETIAMFVRRDTQDAENEVTTKVYAEAKQAELDAQEDAAVTRGAFSRFVHRVWSHV
jgi:hypothetical protein